jgi:hypothetical protein
MLSTLFLSLAPALAPAPAVGELVAVQAGTVHIGREGRVIEGGATVLLSDGKILAVGKDVAVPPGARVVDYGPSAVIAPPRSARPSPVSPGSMSSMPMGATPPRWPRG